MKHWEKNIVLDVRRLKYTGNLEQWVNWKGDGCLSPTRTIRAEESVDLGFWDLSHLAFRDPGCFRAGEIHNHIDEWQAILGDNDSDKMIMNWIREGIHIPDFFQYFRGEFCGKVYEGHSPPKAYFQNSNSCEAHTDFITQTIYDRVQNGSMMVWGKVGEVDPPHLVMPLTVEPSKPRLCHNEMFLNLFIKHSPITLDTLKSVPGMVSRDMFCSSCDDKSGYDHVKVTEPSRTYLGVQWGGYYFAYCVIPFGFKASAFIYQTIGMAATSYLRTLSVQVLQYIDDRFIEENRSDRLVGYQSICKAKCALYQVCQVLIRLGYYLSLKKSVFTPSQNMIYLGLIVNSGERSFQLPADKREKFAEVRESILIQKKVSLQSLQRFLGKCVSLILVVPGAKLYIRHVNSAISWCSRNGSDMVMTNDLFNEIAHWRFLDKWEGVMPWRDERHLQLIMATDASLYKWGAVLSVPKSGVEGVCTGDYWPIGDTRPIHLKEADALINALMSASPSITNGRVDAYVDSMDVVCAWRGQGCKSLPLNERIKTLFELTLKYNCYLQVFHVRTNDNPADQPSRAISLSDAMLVRECWERLDATFGPHTLDLMALDSNAQWGRQGSGRLKHFTPTPMPQSEGVNVFAQTWGANENLYVFPPFNMIEAVLLFVASMGIPCTFVAPTIHPCPIWWPLIHQYKISTLLLGVRGQKGVLSFPSRKGYVRDKRGLKWDLVAYRLSFH